MSIDVGEEGEDFAVYGDILEHGSSNHKKKSNSDSNDFLYEY